jgi:hypothetical protein
MGIFSGNALFSGHFWTGERIFGGNLEILLKIFFILMNYGVSDSVSIQMPFYEAFNCSIWRSFILFYKKMPFI